MKFLPATAFASVLGLATPLLAADVVIGVPNWPSVTVTANVIKEVVEKNMGLTVELQTGTNPVIFEAMDKGSMQVHPEVWLPNQQALVDQSKDKLELNAHPAVAVQGICVNKAALDAGIKDITDLTDPDKAKLLDSDGNGRGEVYIGATGWASTPVERAKAHGYGYDAVLDLVELDEGVAYAQLDAAITAGKPWAGFCYKPHHLFTVHPEMTYLTEPAYDATAWKMVQPDQDADWLSKSNVAMAWPPVYVQPVFAKTLAQSAPMVATLLRNMDLNADDLGAFSYAVVIEKKDAA
ncbi:MAG: glycine betaine ABC transporter substrate-binding protein [Cypionkella sp.]